MNLEQLRTFCEVVTLNGFGRAARSRFLTQSAVSLQIASLERELGARLFERQGRRIALTGPGLILFRYARRAIALVDEAARAVGEAEREGHASLAIGACPTIADCVLAPVLGRYHARHPAVRCSVEVASAEALARRVLADELDLALLEEPVEAPELTQYPFLVDRLVLIVPACHPWADREAVHAPEMSGEPYVAQEPGNPIRRVVEQRLEAAGVRLRPVLEIAGSEAVKRAVAAGLGVAVTSELAVRFEVATGTLRALHIRDVNLEREFLVLVRPEKRTLPLVADLLALL